MAVISNFGDVNLSTASGFWRAESYNLGMFSTTQLALTSTRTINVTFANAGTLKKVIIAVNPVTVSTASIKSCTITLKESGTIRASVTLTGAQITNSVPFSSSTIPQTTPASDSWIIPFTGFDYAVTTGAGVWTLEITQSGAETSNLQIRTSDATNPFYVAVCDNLVTFANNDVLIVDGTAGKVTIDQSFTVKGVLGTGEATRSVACIITKSLTPAVADVASLLWDDTPASSFTMTLDGLCVISAHGGFRAGTSAARIPNAQMGTITIIAATSGTATGFSHPPGAGQLNSKGSFFIFGEAPALQATLLSADYATGATVIVTTDATGWAVNDTFCVGGNVTKGSGDRTVHTITIIAGTSITFTPALAGTNRKQHGSVIKLNGYGMHLNVTASSTTAISLNCANNITIDGCQLSHANNTSVVGGGGNAGPNLYGEGDDTANTSARSFKNLTCRWAATVALFIPGMESPQKGIFFDKAYLIGQTFNGVNLISVANGLGLYITNSRVMFNNAANTARSSPSKPFTVQNCRFEGTTNSFGGALLLNSNQLIMEDNWFWGMANSASAGGIGGAVNWNGAINPISVARNSYNNCTNAICFGGNTIGVVDTDSIFGNVTANTDDVIIETDGIYVDYEFVSPTGLIDFLLTNLNLTTPGTHIKITDNNDTANYDLGYLKYGYYVRTGFALTDTTVRTSGATFGAASAGKFALRLEPTSSVNPLNWPNLVRERAVPTGNIQNQAMTVLVWVKMNNAAYYAATHQKPRLNVKYDNATTVYTEAAASTTGQLLAVSFTPTTAYPQIEVWLSGFTDATGSNAHIYVDDLSVLYPAGANLNLGNLDLWAHATPAWPPIATVYPAGSHWDEQFSAHVAAGSFGDLAADTFARIGPPVGTSIADDIADAALALAAILGTPAGASLAADIATRSSHTPADILDLANGIETGLTPRQALRLMAAALAGKISGGGTVTIAVRNAVADTKPRLTATVDLVTGDRTAIVADVT